MITFQWNQDYMTDLPSVDGQHRHLVDLINQLGRSLGDNGVSRADLQSLFGELVSYAQFHFQDEERLMRETGIDERHIDRHVSSHRRFLKDVDTLQSTDSGPAERSGAGILDYLVHWLAYHILGQDQDMARQIEAVRSGAEPAEAFDRHEREKEAAIEPLLAALNQLLQQLSARNRELVELNHSLEERVAERTQALSQANDELKALSLTDVLTGLSNRRHAMMLLATLWEESDQTGQSLAALMIDADNFKIVNDTYGHDAGDTVLMELARELQHSLRSDDLIFRLGGDEFLVLCPATDFDGAMQVGRSLLDRVAKMSVPTGSGFWKNSISVGVAVRTAPMRVLDELIKAADDSVYLAKDAGRNCVRASQESPV
ncbi:GGDEF domain-containing protein [Wenzhouxiangella limi]|uniref:diguanylate cyclase n=1 Tax=Wenzhouxiangella limi TaxID=2707351 RepID=A0A845V4Y3_9GAMM|nr:GGDEF domain-containing protein [Wenzhouxiangella limi]NDY96246.1 bacteriohemerythrin [Wenzhouxiangella limi]